MKQEKYIRNGFLAWTLTSNGYKYLTWNFVLHWKKAVPETPLCIVCADKAAQQFFQREGISCVLADDMLADFGAQVVPFGSRQFATLNRLKLKLLNFFAKQEAIQQCLQLDGDIIVYKNIVEDLRQRLQIAPLWAPCDEQPVECSATAEVPCPNFCTGLLAWNHGADQGIFDVYDKDVWQQKPEDQVWVNQAARQKGVSVAVLPRAAQPNGARLNYTKTNPERMEEAICLHQNQRIGTVKQADIKRYGDWLLPQ